MYDRVHSAARMLARRPGLTGCIQAALFDSRNLPLSGERELTLLNFGTGTTVFLASSRDRTGRLVLKVYRYSLGRRLPTLLKQAAQQRAAYRTLCRWYAGCSVVLPTAFLVLHGPLLRIPALACVQPYVDENHACDVFSGLPEHALLEQLRRHEPLRRQFVVFVERTLHAARTEHASADLVGRNNLVLSGEGERLRLQLLDVYVHDFATRRARSPHNLAEIESRLVYLRRIRDAVLRNAGRRQFGVEKSDR
jgi:hypothetical protein